MTEGRPATVVSAYVYPVMVRRHKDFVLANIMAALRWSVTLLLPNDSIQSGLGVGGLFDYTYW